MPGAPPRPGPNCRLSLAGTLTGAWRSPSPFHQFRRQERKPWKLHQTSNLTLACRSFRNNSTVMDIRFGAIGTLRVSNTLGRNVSAVSWTRRPTARKQGRSRSVDQLPKGQNLEATIAPESLSSRRNWPRIFPVLHCPWERHRDSASATAPTGTNNGNVHNSTYFVEQGRGNRSGPEECQRESRTSSLKANPRITSF